MAQARQSKTDKKPLASHIIRGVKEGALFSFPVLTNHTDHSNVFNEKKNNGLVAKQGNVASLTKKFFAAYKLYTEDKPRFDEISQS